MISSTDDDELLHKRQHNLGRMLAELASYFHHRVLAHLHAHGYKDLRPSHLGILMNTSLEGTRQTILAQRTAISRQAVGQVVDDLEKLGYLKRIPDPSDARSVLIGFTQHGKQMLTTAMAGIDATEQAYAAIVGQRQATSLRRSLTKLVEALQIELPLVTTITRLSQQPHQATTTSFSELASGFNTTCETQRRYQSEGSTPLVWPQQAAGVAEITLSSGNSEH
jgi:DNA-binding MarR family transcriptional regulator